MSTVIVRYKVKQERVNENIGLVQAVYAELGEKKPDGLRYASFMAEDGVTFFHIASVDAYENPLFKSVAFKAFQKDIAERCDEAPGPTRVSEIGSYNFHGPASSP